MDWKKKCFWRSIFITSIFAAIMVTAGCNQSESNSGNPPPKSADKQSISVNQDQSIEKQAKVEGKVVVYATGGSTAESVIPAFQKKYPGINVQVVTLRGPE